MALSTGLFAANATAAQKIGVINTQAVFQQLPQAAEVETAIRSEFKDQIESVNRLEKDIAYYMEKLKRDGATMSEKEKEEAQQKVLQLRQEYTTKGKELDAKIRQRQTEERNKIAALIKGAIDEIAKEEKLDIVLTAAAVAYIDEDGDANISEKVLKKLTSAK
nr:OmpH family outer membrane protein [Marinifaba aquimaris]